MTDIGYVNLIKLCVGVYSVEDLVRWQRQALESGRFRYPEHVTRSRPRRAPEILNGGSLYWVINGRVQARQKIIGIESRLSEDGITRCALVFDPQIVLTFPVLHRPFQGWRYLSVKDSPRDLGVARGSEDWLPEQLRLALLEIGVI